MINLSAEQLRRLSYCICSLYALEDLEAFPRRAVQAVAQLTGSDKTAYNEICLRTRRRLRFVGTGPPVEPRELQVFEHHVREHPLVAHCREHPPIRISDFLSQEDFHRTGLYNEFFKGVDAEYQMAVGIPACQDASELVLGIALNRKLSDFSQDDRDMLGLLAPHLRQAYRNAAAMDQARQSWQNAERTLAAMVPTVATVSPDGKILQATDAVHRLLERFFRWPAAGGSGHLPENVRDWLRRQLTELTSGDAPGPHEPLVETGPGRWLTIRLILRPENRHYLVLQEHSIDLRAAACMRLGLTPPAGPDFGLDDLGPGQRANRGDSPYQPAHGGKAY
jgi:hypothetical protein